MKNIFSVLLVLTSTLSPALAHWNYDELIVNGQIVGEPYQYIRRTLNSNSPIENVQSIDMRCNTGGASGKNTQTYTVKAGDELGFAINESFGHPGPQQVYLSKAPGTAADYDGSGGWAKIYSLTTSTINDKGLQWAGDGMKSFRFNLPSSTPPGEYLLRAEGLALHGAGTKGGAQFYIGCAQINVTGSGNGSPGPLVKFPGAYAGEEPGILIGIYWPTPTNYTVPGPALWPAGTQEQHSVKQL
ncbi:lytic polysaccharide monooxygenase [Zopfia rhizophila CBS 207.26]|uniref:lytic cellulose monooxygenase (C4-dehydrogenating) n=1 Tax=Zopfia rhizophila CBS 207.26 TaxID=1314779 RepID=A0A6A6ENG5_9PEZI|nr:lytic polysaccharide monooxygenase [Zopfia rhizophila CBS 207.26]